MLERLKNKWRAYLHAHDTLLGLDVGTSSVRCIELVSRDNQYHINAYGIESIPPEFVLEGEIKDVAGVGAAIAKLLKKMKTSSTDVALAVPTSNAMTKIVQFPAVLTEDEIEEQLQVDAHKYIPYSVDEVAMDFEILGPSANDKTSVDVLIVAMRSESVDTLVEAMELGGLHPQVVETTTLAIERACNHLSLLDPKYALSAIFDIGAMMTNVNILQEGRIIYSRDLNFGGRVLVEELQQQYQMSIKEAYERQQVGDLPDGFNENIWQPFRENVAQHISRALQFFYSTSNYRSIDSIFLAGGIARMNGLVEYLEQTLSTPIFILNPLKYMTISNKLRQKEILQDAPSLLISCGLALRSGQS